MNCWYECKIHHEEEFELSESDLAALAYEEEWREQKIYESIQGE